MPANPASTSQSSARSPFFHGPVKFTDIEGMGFLEILLYLVFIEKIHGRRLINDKDADLVFLCRPDNRASYPV